MEKLIGARGEAGSDGEIGRESGGQGSPRPCELEGDDGAALAAASGGRRWLKGGGGGCDCAGAIGSSGVVGKKKENMEKEAGVDYIGAGKPDVAGNGSISPE